LENLPFDLQLKSVEKEDYDFVNQFARETGDFYNLSENDKMLIALAVRLAKDKNLFHLVKSHPESLEEFKPKFVKMMEDDLKSEDEEEEEEEEQEEQKPVDEWQVAPEPKRNLRKQQHLIEKAQKLIKSQADQQPVAEEAKVPDQTLVEKRRKKERVRVREKQM